MIDQNKQKIAEIIMDKIFDLRYGKIEIFVKDGQIVDIFTTIHQKANEVNENIDNRGRLGV